MPQGKGRPYNPVDKSVNYLRKYSKSETKPLSEKEDYAHEKLETRTKESKEPTESWEGKKRERSAGTKLQNRVQEIAQEKSDKASEQKRRSIATRILVTPGKWKSKG